MTELIQFILAHYPLFRESDPANLRGWLEWHADHGFIQKAIDLDGNIAGVLIARTIMNPQGASDWYAYDPEGSVIFVDLVIATKPAFLQLLTLAGLKRYGQRDWVAWRRPPYFVTKFRETKRVLDQLLKGVTYGQ